MLPWLQSKDCHKGKIDKSINIELFEAAVVEYEIGEIEQGEVDVGVGLQHGGEVVCPHLVVELGPYCHAREYHCQVYPHLHREYREEVTVDVERVVVAHQDVYC